MSKDKQRRETKKPKKKVAKAVPPAARAATAVPGASPTQKARANDLAPWASSPG